LKISLSIAQREKILPKKFKEQDYYFWLPVLPKLTAEELSKDARKIGYLARMVKVAGGYEIYIKGRQRKDGINSV